MKEAESSLFDVSKTVWFGKVATAWQPAFDVQVAFCLSSIFLASYFD